MRKRKAANYWRLSENVKSIDNLFRNSIEILEKIIINLQAVLLQTIDGCILLKDSKTDVLKVYIDTFNLEILLNVHSFWKNNYDHISVYFFKFRMLI